MNMHLFVIRSSIFSLHILKNVSKNCYATIAKKEVLDELVVEDTPSYLVEPKYSKSEINIIRNKSRLNKNHENILNNKRPYEKSMEWYHDTIWYKKKMIGRFGIKAADITPAIVWPTEKQVEDIKEYERHLYPMSIQESLEQIKERKKAEAMTIKHREECIDNEVAKFSKWKKDLHEKFKKKMYEKYLAREKKRKVIDEMQEKFGYAIKGRDARAKEYLKEKLEDEKVMKKQEKKKNKEEKLFAYIQKQEKMLENESNRNTNSDNNLSNADELKKVNEE